MRLVAQAKGGFYAAPPAALAMAARWLQPPAKQRFCILDPCCGQGAAIVQLAEALGCPMPDVYAIELDERRSETVQQTLGAERGSHVLAPASFFGTGISRKAFSFVWCNPPFDNELGGGQRVEHTFLERSTHLLVTGGVIALVCPEHVAERSDIQELLLTWYTDVRVVTFPADHRPFGEVIVFGVKREKQVPSTEQSWKSLIRRRSGDDAPDFRYRLPQSTGPTRFEKTEMTESELLVALAKSPLRRFLEVADAPPLPSPPMSLNKGHRAMLLAAGHLDGRVCPPGEPPHVVRGTATKQSYVQSVETHEEPDGDVTKTVIAEKIMLTVRVATADGRILTLTQGGTGQSADTQAGDAFAARKRTRRAAA
jgi:16S rRNA G966 N2-methylase RsmD